MSFSKKENLLFLIIICTLAGLITYIQYTKWIFDSPHRGDSAFLLEVTENIAKQNTTKSYDFGAFYHFNFGNIQSKTADILCTQELNRFSDEAIDVMRNHSYYVLYIIAQLARVIDTKLLFYCLHVTSFFVLLYFTYRIMRESDVPIIASVLFLLLVFIHPAFSISISGQFYVERFFLAFAMMFLYLMHEKKSNLALLYIVSFFICLLTERAPMYIGIFLTMYILLFWKSIESNKRWHLIFLTTILLSYTVFALNNIKTLMGNQISTYLPTTATELISRLSNAMFLENLYVFLLCSFIFLGIFTFVHWKYLVMLTVMLVPNIIGNIGGAEKYGYFTHYHTLYFPFAVFLSVLGYIKIVTYLKTNTHRSLAALVMIGLICFSSLYSPYNRKLAFINVINENVLFKDFHLYKELFNQHSSTRQYLNDFEKMNEIIPPGAVVSSFEIIIANLWKDRIHYMFPLGLDQADYVVMQVVKENDEYKYSGFTSYVLTPSQIRAVDNCMIERMKKIGYDFQHQVIINGYAIIKRERNE
ncbi:hypothetical protein [Sulfurospirillum sp.]|uniref:hypothetical protein n=1 Tax=Sulfurospirillum sp. TaxID=2053622 RepID=UPI002FDE4BD8